MRRVFRTRSFSRWARGVNLLDEALRGAVAEMAAGLIDADFGGHVFKKRIALPGHGKRGGARTIVATQLRDRWIFVYGFAKNERDDIDRDELKALQETARELLSFDDRELATAICAGELVEIVDGNA